MAAPPPPKTFADTAGGRRPDGRGSDPYRTLPLGSLCVSAHDASCRRALCVSLLSARAEAKKSLLEIITVLESHEEQLKALITEAGDDQQKRMASVVPVLQKILGASLESAGFPKPPMGARRAASCADPPSPSSDARVAPASLLHRRHAGDDGLYASVCQAGWRGAEKGNGHPQGWDDGTVPLKRGHRGGQGRAGMKPTPLPPSAPTAAPADHRHAAWRLGCGACACRGCPRRPIASFMGSTAVLPRRQAPGGRACFGGRAWPPIRAPY